MTYKHKWKFYGSTTPSGEYIWVCVDCGKRSTGFDTEEEERDCDGSRRVIHEMILPHREEE